MFAIIIGVVLMVAIGMIAWLMLAPSLPGEYGYSESARADETTKKEKS